MVPTLRFVIRVRVRVRVRVRRACNPSNPSLVTLARNPSSFVASTLVETLIADHRRWIATRLR